MLLCLAVVFRRAGSFVGCMDVFLPSSYVGLVLVSVVCVILVVMAGGVDVVDVGDEEKEDFMSYVVWSIEVEVLEIVVGVEVVGSWAVGSFCIGWGVGLWTSEFFLYITESEVAEDARVWACSKRG